MPQAVDNCVESAMSEEDATESEAYAICWSRYNDGELKEDEDYEWGPYTDEEEDEEEKDVEEKVCGGPGCDCEDCNCDEGGDCNCESCDCGKPIEEKSTFEIAREIHYQHDVDEQTAKTMGHAVSAALNAGFEDPLAVKSVALRTATGEWKSVHPSEKTREGRDHLRETYKYVVDKILGQGEVAKTLSKSQSMEKIDFTAEFSGSQTVFKSGDEFVIWGPASVEVVDKEGDRIHAEALEDALPQLLKRGRLSLEHSDQLVGEIIESFELEDPVELEVNGKTFKRKEFPTDVLELNGQDPALYVCGKIYDDTRQSKRVRESIEEGELNSYSISGEALVSRSKIEDGEPVNDIVEMDLSAVTVCEEGMNQHANFVTVKKGDEDDEISPNVLTIKSDEGQTAIIKGDDSGNSDEHPGDRAIVITKNSSSNMSDKDTSEESQELTLNELKGEFESVVKDALSEEDFAQEDDILGKDEIEDIVDDMIEQKMEDGSTSEDDDVEKDDEDDSLTEEDVKGIVKELLEDGSEEDVEKEDDGLTQDDLREVVEEVVKQEEDEDEDEEEDEKAEQDEEEEEEEEKDVEDGKQMNESELAEALADLVDVPVDEATEMINELQSKQAEEDEDEEEEKGEEEEDEEEEKGEYEEEMEDEDEEKGDGSSQYTVTELQEKLPEDVFDAVRGYIGEEKDVESAEKSDEDVLEGLNIDKAVEQAVEQQFNVSESPGAPESDDDVEKSYEDEGTEMDQNPALSIWK